MHSNRPATSTKKSDGESANKNVVVASFLHVCSCKDCGKKMKKIVEEMQGVKSAEIIDRSAVRVKGAFDPEELREYVAKKTGKKNLVLLTKPNAIMAEVPKDPHEKTNGGGCRRRRREEDVKEEVKAISSTTHIDRDHLVDQKKEEAVPAPARQEAAAGVDGDSSREETGKGGGGERRKVAVFEVRPDHYRRSDLARLVPRILATPGVEAVEFDVVSCSRMTVEGSFDVCALNNYIYKKTKNHVRLTQLEILPDDDEEMTATTKLGEKGGDASTARWWC